MIKNDQLSENVPGPSPHSLSRQNECQIDPYVSVSSGASVRVLKASEIFVFIMCDVCARRACMLSVR